MPQSKKNITVSVSREVHATLLDIVKKAKKETKKNTGLKSDYSLSDVIKMLVDSYQSK